MLARNFDFLKHKYRELLLPTLLMLLSDKICFIVDVALIGFFISDSTLLAAINLASLSSTFQQFYTPIWCWREPIGTQGKIRSG